MIESIREILQEGPDDRFRSALKQAVDRILSGEMNIRELPGYLRPVLRRLAISYKGRPLIAVQTLLRF